jgi:hypothetical protein
VTAEELRALALELPETAEGSHAGLATFHVRGRRFATLGWPEAGSLTLMLAPEGQAVLVASEPSLSRRLDPGRYPTRTEMRISAAPSPGFSESVLIQAKVSR